MTQRTLQRAAIALSVAIGVVASVLLLSPLVSNAILVTSPPRILQTGDVDSSNILDGTIQGVDISTSASTTMFRLQVSDLLATSTLTVNGTATFDDNIVIGGTSNTSTFAGGLAIETSGFVYDFSTNNIGIGTASPSQKLHISGNILFENANQLKWKDSGGTEQVVLRVDSGDIFTVRSAQSGGIALEIENNAASTLVTVEDGGDVGIGTTSPFATLSIDHGAGEIPFAIGSTTATSFIVDAKGQVGVGTTSPGTPLGVTGDANVDGTLTTTNLDTTGTFRWNGVSYTGPGADGASSTALMTDGAGNLSYNTIGSQLLVAEATSTSVSSSASTTMFAHTIPADTLGSNIAVIKGQAHFQFGTTVSDVDDVLEMSLVFGGDTVATTSLTMVNFQGLANAEGTLDFFMTHDGTNQIGSFNFVGHNPAGTPGTANPMVQFGSQDRTTAEAVNVDQLFQLIGTWGGANGSYQLTTVYIELVR